MRGFIAVDVFKVLVLLCAVDMDQFNESILLLHLLESLLLIPSILRISQIINRHRTRVESENPPHSKHITIKRDRNRRILQRKRISSLEDTNHGR